MSMKLSINKMYGWAFESINMELSIYFNNINGLFQVKRLRLASILNTEHLIHNGADLVCYRWFNC